MEHNPLQDLQRILHVEREALLSGDIESALTVQTVKEDLLKNLTQSNRSPVELATVAKQIERNQYIIRAVVRGLSETRADGSAGATSFIYTKNGRLRSV